MKSREPSNFCCCVKLGNSVRVSCCDDALNRHRRTRTARVSEDNLHRNSLHRHTLRESLRRNMDVSTDLDVASLTHERKQSTVEEKKPENEEEEENVSLGRRRRLVLRGLTAGGVEGSVKITYCMSGTNDRAVSLAVVKLAERLL